MMDYGVKIEVASKIKTKLTDQTKDQYEIEFQ